MQFHFYSYIITTFWKIVKRQNLIMALLLVISQIQYVSEYSKK